MMRPSEEKIVPVASTSPTDAATKPSDTKMATIEDDDERLLNQIGYAQVSTVSSLSYPVNNFRT